MNDVVLITGSSRGIGAATATLFAKRGYQVVIHYCTGKKEAYALQTKLREYNCNTLVVKADVAVESEVKDMVDAIIHHFGCIDVLVNNAGISIDTLFEDKTVENFRRTLDVNLIGTFLVSKYVGDQMYKQKKGCIINLSSTNGIDQFFPMCLDYDASKAGVISLTHNLALQYSPYVRVNAVAPGWIATENEIKELDSDYITSEEDKIFLKRFGRPEEVATTIFFLASSDASYINGTVIRIDGGN